LSDELLALKKTMESETKILRQRLSHATFESKHWEQQFDTLLKQCMAVREKCCQHNEQLQVLQKSEVFDPEDLFEVKKAVTVQSVAHENECIRGQVNLIRKMLEKMDDHDAHVEVSVRMADCSEFSDEPEADLVDLLHLDQGDGGVAVIGDVSSGVVKRKLKELEKIQNQSDGKQLVLASWGGIDENSDPFISKLTAEGDMDLRKTIDKVLNAHADVTECYILCQEEDLCLAENEWSSLSGDSKKFHFVSFNHAPKLARFGNGRRNSRLKE